MSKSAIPTLSGPLMMSKSAAIKLRTALAAGSPPDGFEVADSSAYEIQVDRGVAIINIVGTLTKYESPYPGIDEWYGLCPTAMLADELRELRDNDNILAIILKIDSGGGYVSGTNEFAELVADVVKKKPVYAVVSDDCCSGAYYIASQCTSITANAQASIGSIGVVVVVPDDAEFWKKMGIEWKVVASGDIKALGRDGTVPPEYIAELQKMIDASAEIFINIVAKGRNLSVEQVRQLATGEVWLAEEAKTLGLIDRIERVDVAISRIIQETITMTIEEFKAFAKANPQATAEFIEQGKQAAIEELKPKAAKAADLKAEFSDPSDRDFVFDRIGVDASIDEHREAHRQKLLNDRKTLNAEISTLKEKVAEGDPGSAGQSQPLNAKPPAATTVNPLIANAEARAKAAK